MKNILLIDGEYYEKQIKPHFDNLEEIIYRYFGVFSYPDEVIYYSTAICDEKRKKLLKIKNIIINERGYIVNRDSTFHQKAVDGYIISDLTDLSHEDVGVIALISGDGDMKAGVEKIYKRKDKKVQIIGMNGSVSPELQDFCDFHYIDVDFSLAPSLNNENKKVSKKSENSETKLELDIDKNLEKYLSDENWKSFIKTFEKVKKSTKDETVTSSSIGKEANSCGFNYPKRKLQTILEVFEKMGKIKLEKHNKHPEHYITLLSN